MGLSSPETDDSVVGLDQGSSSSTGAQLAMSEDCFGCLLMASSAYRPGMLPSFCNVQGRPLQQRITHLKCQGSVVGKLPVEGAGGGAVPSQCSFSLLWAWFIYHLKVL